mmetsp:Transcript_22343/g.46328  ORF Transcript_22343/g.46328 Transcript_22343/m.46328 type:complete len:779 (+) Transcript_22343:446-2782(+)
MSGWKRSRRMVGTMSATQCANSWPLDAADSIRTSTSASRSADEDADPAIGRTRTRAFCSSSSRFLFLVSLAILSVAAFPSAVASGPRVSEMTIEETWSETERMSLRGHHTTAKTTTRTRVPVRVRPSSSRGDGGRTITSNRVLTAEAYTDTKVGTRRTQDRCTIEIKDKISIDGITETVKVDTTLKNLCLADIKVTMLTMSSCVLCDGQEFADAECSPAVSVLEEFIAFNNGSDVIEENIEKEISFALELQSFGGGPGVACSSSYFTKFNYEAEALALKSEVEELEKEIQKKLDEVKFDIEKAEEVIKNEGSGTGGITGNSDPVTKKKRSRRRVCSDISERNKCLRCQLDIREKFEDGECGNDLAAAREGRDCNKFFDRYRVAVFRRKCRRWRDLYANCFLPQAVSPNPNRPETCETACNIEIKGESTYKNKRLTTGVAIYSDCGGAVSIEELTYAFCSECSQADGTVEKKCDEPPIDILGELEKVNGGTTVLPPDAQRYFEVVSDEFEGNCQAYAKISYDAFAAFQVFYESFSASVEADCSDDEGGAGPRPIQPSPSLDAAFANYFQDEENCVYADLDGCGGRDVIFAGVDSIKEGECVEVADPTASDNPTPQGDIDPSRRDLQIKKKKKRRFLKINGVNRKRGRCRRKCASRKKKVSDNIGSNTGDGRRLQQVQCVNPDAKRPNLTRELRKREEEIGFTPTRAAVTQVRELSCAVESRACREGACCGTEGCTCSEVDFTEENCLAGTKKRDAEVIVPCFLSLNGGLDENNECSSYC